MNEPDRPAPAGTANGTGPRIRVRVHYNLRQGGFAVVNPSTGRVVCYVDDITLDGGVEFRVQGGTLDRIRAEGRRAVCAYALGLVAAVDTCPDVSGLPRVTFNPWRARTFTLGGQPIHAAQAVIFAGRAGWLPQAAGAPGSA